MLVNETKVLREHQPLHRFLSFVKYRRAYLEGSPIGAEQVRYAGTSCSDSALMWRPMVSALALTSM